MKPVYVFIIMCTSGTIAFPWGSSTFSLGPGTIVEKTLDFFLYTKSLVMEVTMDAIFLTEDNVLR